MSKQKLDLTQYKIKPIVTPGVKHLDTKEVKTSLIYVPPMIDNPLRTDGLDLTKVEALTIALPNGINYGMRAPILRKNHRTIDGQIYDYDLVDGHHRFEAMFHAGIDEWIFEIYEFGLNKVSFEDSFRTLQLVTNDHLPQNPSTITDVANTISRLIKMGSKLVSNDEKSIGKYVDTYCKNMAYQTRGKIVKMVVSACGSYQDIVNYTPLQADQWATKHGYSTQGDYDMHKQACGWITKEGYENDILINGSRKFADTGKHSYFICYTAPPTKNEDLNAKRTKMLNKIASAEKTLIAVFEYYQKHNCFPWTVEGFIPSDRLAEEDPDTLVQIT